MEQDYLQCSSHFPSHLYFHIFFFSFHCFASTCAYALILLFPFHTAFYFSQFHASPRPPPIQASSRTHAPHKRAAQTHTAYSGKDSPCVVQAVSPVSHLSPSLFLSFPPAFHPPSPECLDRSKWCDCDCSAGRLPLSVFGKSDVKGKGRGREKKGKVLLNNKAWRPSRESNPAS